MKRRAITLMLLVMVMGCTLVLMLMGQTKGDAPEKAAVSESPVKKRIGVYLGVADYETMSAEQKGNFCHRFYIDGQEQSFTIASASDGSYQLQNRLAEGELYELHEEAGQIVMLTEPQERIEGRISDVTEHSLKLGKRSLKLGGIVPKRTVLAPGGASVEETALVEEAYGVGATDGERISALYLTEPKEEYQPPVCGVPGRRTLKNFLATAMMPVGTSLYVYGGGWNWQDDGAGPQATQIGLAQAWVDFFGQQDQNYRYRNEEDPTHSYDPPGRWNQYYYAGLDCAGYLGWAVYNLMETQNGKLGYVDYADRQAKLLADRGFGYMVQGNELQPGDVISMKEHVWICVGCCEDGSVVMLHSTPYQTGGAGVQLSALGGDKTCAAYQLAKHYMDRYYPKWSERYGNQVLCMNKDSYLQGEHFRWKLDDSEGYASWPAEEILKDLFGG